MESGGVWLRLRPAEVLVAVVTAGGLLRRYVVHEAAPAAVITCAVVTGAA